jgi:hypothetical protein
MSETLSNPSGPLPSVPIPAASPAVSGVRVVRQETFASRDGKDQEEVIEWEDGATLQIHRPGMGPRCERKDGTGGNP